MSITDWAMVLVAVTFVMSTFVVVVWGLGAPWYRSQIGRAFLLTEVSLCCLVGPSVIAYWLHFQIGPWWGIAILGGIAGTSVYRAVAVFNEQIVGRLRARREES